MSGGLDGDRQRRAEELFEALRGLSPAERRAALAAAGDDAVAAEAASLLAAHDDAAGRFEAPTPGEVGAWIGNDASWTGLRIGGCTVTRRLAAGGMGVVLEAEQRSPRRTVAVKVMRASLPEESRARFEHETRVIAGLNHPGIAQIYSAGSHDGTLPYFVMELVPGARTLIEYADGERLDRAARLGLFAKVCDAVHFGHSRGVIHRDIKPGNILVDREGHPKVIDFGVAKLVGDGDSGLTRTGTFFGTIGYASPEQIAGRHAEVGTRSDVYSLGVVLYELMTGTLPVALAGLDLLAAARAVEIERPAPHAALEGDLRLVVGRALAKEPEVRYDSAAALALEVRRLLRGEPIEARAPTLGYHVRLLARRHKAAFAASGIVVAALVAATVVSVRAAAEAREQQRVAESATERSRGMLRASQDAIGRMAGEVFDQLAPLPGSLETRRMMASVLDDALDGLTRHVGEDAELRRLAARTATQLSRIYGAASESNLGETQRAIELQAHALAELEALGSRGSDRLEAHLQMAGFRLAAGQLEEALVESDRALALFDELGDPSPSRLLDKAACLQQRAQMLSAQGRVDDGLAALHDARTIADALPESAGRDKLLSEVEGALGHRLLNIGRREEAEPHLRASGEALDRMAARLESPVTLLTRRGLLAFRWGDLAALSRHHDVAVGHFNEAARLFREWLGLEPRDAKVRFLLALTLTRAGRSHSQLAKRMYKFAVALDEPPRKPGMAEAQEHYAAAIGLLGEAVDEQRALVEADPSRRKHAYALCEGILDLAVALSRTKSFDGARALLDEATEMARGFEARNPDDAEAGRILTWAVRTDGAYWVNLSDAQGTGGDVTAARASLERAVESFRLARDRTRAAKGDRDTEAAQLTRLVEAYERMLGRPPEGR